MAVERGKNRSNPPRPITLRRASELQTGKAQVLVETPRGEMRTKRYMATWPSPALRHILDRYTREHIAGNHQGGILTSTFLVLSFGFSLQSTVDEVLDHSAGRSREMSVYYAKYDVHVIVEVRNYPI